MYVTDHQAGNQLLTLEKTTKPATAYLMSLPSEVGRKGMKSQLLKVARILGAPHYDYINWSTLNASVAQAILTKVSEPVSVVSKVASKNNTTNPDEIDNTTNTTRITITPSPATIKMVLSAIKGVAKACWQLELISTDNYLRIKEVKPPRGSRNPAGRDIEDGEKYQLLHSINADPTPAGKRDKALFALLMSTGVRRAEALSLKLTDYEPITGRIRILGKGNKERTVYIKNGAEKALKEWLEIRTTVEGAIFCVISKGKTIYTNRHLTPASLNDILTKRLKQSGLTNISLHDFRRTFAGDLLDANVDISTVSKLMGHANTQTTAKYDRRGERVKEAASQFVRVSW